MEINDQIDLISSVGGGMDDDKESNNYRLRYVMDKLHIPENDMMWQTLYEKVLDIELHMIETTPTDGEGYYSDCDSTKFDNVEAVILEIEKQTNLTDSYGNVYCF